ncbi:hypothetical protein E2I00_002955, partial [Balaenoptera physalus]
YQVSKPEVIFKLEQGEEPWIAEGEIQRPFCPGGRIHHFCLILDNMRQLPNILHNSLQEKCAWGLKCGKSSPTLTIQKYLVYDVPRLAYTTMPRPCLCCLIRGLTMGNSTWNLLY